MLKSSEETSRPSSITNIHSFLQTLNEQRVPRFIIPKKQITEFLKMKTTIKSAVFAVATILFTCLWKILALSFRYQFWSVSQEV